MSARKRRSKAQPPGSQPAAAPRKSAAPPVAISLSRKILFASIAVALFFLSLEWALALAGITPVTVRDDPYVGFTAQAPLFVPLENDHHQIMMTTAPNKLRWFNQQTFPRDKQPGAYRVFSLGGSTTYGHPYEDPTSFSGWLRELLPARDPTRRWEVINAGGISYASYRVVKIVEELIRYEPDLLIVYSGHNEFLEERTYRSIRQTPPWLRNLGALASRTRVYAAAHGILRRPMQEQSELAGKELGEEVLTRLDQGVGPDAFERDEMLKQSVIEHFRFNLERIVELAASAGVDVIFVTPASNLADCSPFKSQHRSGLAETDRRRWQSNLEAARKAAADNQLETALSHVAAAEAIDSQPAELHYLKGQLLRRLGRFEEARLALAKALDEDVCPLRAISPLVQSVRDVAARLKVPLVDFQQQIEQLSKDDIPGNELFLDHVHPTIDANRRLALTLLEKMDAMQILSPNDAWSDQSIAEAVERVEARLDPQSQGRALRNLAKVLTWAGKKEEARQLGLRAAELIGDDADACVLAGNTLLEKGDVPAAIEKFQQALRIDPRHTYAHNSLGSALHRAGRLNEAIEQYQRVVELAPGFAPVHNNLGAVYQRQAKWDLADHHYSEAIRLNPRFAAAHNNLGVVKRKLGRLDEAETCCLKALEINPKYAEAIFNLGIVRSAQQRSDEAIAAFQEAIQIDPNYGPAHVHLGMEWERHGDMDAAIEQYRQAMKRRGGQLAAARRVAWIHATALDASRRNSRLALQLAQQCAEITQFADAESLTALAAAHAESGDFDAAVRWQTKAAEIASTDDTEIYKARLDRLRQQQPLRGFSGLEK